MYSNKSGAAGINPETTGVVVSTIEKANILVNRLLEEEKMGILSCLVIDELHMVHSQLQEIPIRTLITCWNQASLSRPNGDSGHGSIKQGTPQMVSAALVQVEGSCEILL